jgi:hypothetical protein
MTLAEAKHYVRQVLAGALGRRVKPAHRYTAKCSRKSATRVACGVQFWHGPNDYYGTITVYLVGRAKWTDYYTIHWVNEHCYYHSDHPHRCKIQTRRGTW